MGALDLTGNRVGFCPAARYPLSRPNLDSWLREGTRSSPGKGNRLRHALLVSEVALAIMLLSGAGLLIRSFGKLLDVDPGYQPQNLLTAQLRFPPRYDDSSKRAEFCDRLLERLAALPGVASAGATSQLPLTRYNLGGTLRVQDATTETGKRETAAPITAVNTDYFRTMRIGLRSGRFFEVRDGQGAASVCVLSASLSKKPFPEEDPIGRSLFAAGTGADRATVIGIVDDVRHQGLDHDIEPAAYLSYRQLTRPMMSLVLRTKTPPLSLASTLRLANRRFNLMLPTAFAGFALLLAGVGIYGVITYSVSERTHEVGIRIALGAGQGEVVAMVVTQGMRLTGIGLLLGVAAVGIDSDYDKAFVRGKTARSTDVCCNGAGADLDRPAGLLAPLS